MFKHEIRRQMSVYFETQQTVIQSTTMTDFSFGFSEGSFLLLNGQKHLRSVPEDLISNKQKRTERIYQKRRRHWYYQSALKHGRRIFLYSAMRELVCSRQLLARAALKQLRSFTMSDSESIFQQQFCEYHGYDGCD